MNKSEQVNELAAALSKAQGEFTNPTPDAEVKTPQYKFRYATLGKVLDTVRPVLAKHGLAVSVLPDIVGWKDTDAVNWRKGVVCLLMHSSGQWLESVLSLPEASKAQELGSHLSYLQRYLVRLMLNLATDEDDDANIADGNAHEKQPVKRAEPKPSTDGKDYKLPLEKALLAIEACKDVPELMRTFQEWTLGDKPAAFVEAVRAKASAKKAQLQPT